MTTAYRAVRQVRCRRSLYSRSQTSPCIVLTPERRYVINVPRTTRRAFIGIDSINPSIDDVGQSSYIIDNEHLDKVGRTTGWTYGAVEDTCTDYEIDGWTRECSDRVDYSTSGGDSGAPVFSLTAGGDAEIRGINFGYEGWPYNDALMSDIYQIQLDVGDLVAFEPDTNADILGPTNVPSGAACKWNGDPEGRPPFSYEWRKDGNVVATTKNYTTPNVGFSDFDLSFRVVDARSDTVTASVNVTTYSSTELQCSW